METLEQVLEAENKMLKQAIKDMEEKMLRMNKINWEMFRRNLELETKLKIYEEMREADVQM